jgi:transposase
MSMPLISDGLWTIVAPLLPPEPPKPKGGRPPSIADRAALTGIVFVLKSDIPWEMLPQELGCGSGMTCWRRLRNWQRAGVWRRLHRALLQRLQDAGRIEWTRASLDSASVPAPGRGEATGKDPTNRGKLGAKRHLVVDRTGMPLAMTVSGANVHDSQRLEVTVDAIPSLRLPGK